MISLELVTHFTEMSEVDIVMSLERVLHFIEMPKVDIVISLELVAHFREMSEVDTVMSLELVSHFKVMTSLSFVQMTTLHVTCRHNSNQHYTNCLNTYIMSIAILGTENFVCLPTKENFTVI